MFNDDVNEVTITLTVEEAMELQMLAVERVSDLVHEKRFRPLEINELYSYRDLQSANNKIDAALLRHKGDYLRIVRDDHRD